MTVIVMSLSFTLIWLGTSFLIIRYVKKLKKELLDRFPDTEKPSDSEEYEKIIHIPFEYIRTVDPKNLLLYIQQEHPQVIALVLAHLEPDKAAVILRDLPCEMQGEVSRRIAAMDQFSPEVICEIERVLEKKLSVLGSNTFSTLVNGVLRTNEYSAAGGVESIVKILNLAGRDSANQIIKNLEDEDPELAEVIQNEIKKDKTPHRKIWRLIKGKSISAVHEKA
jgi:flagellar motor switch protein FliG